MLIKLIIIGLTLLISTSVVTAQEKIVIIGGVTFNVPSSDENGYVSDDKKPIPNKNIAKARQLVEDGKPYKAFKYYKKALAEDKENLAILLEYSDLLLQLAYVNKSVQYLNQAIKLAPEDPRVKTLIQKTQSDYQIQILETEQSSEQDERFSKFLPQQRLFDEEIEAYEEVLEEDFQDYDLGLRTSQLFLDLKQPMPAIGVLEKLIQDNPNDLSLKLKLSDIYIGEKDLPKAKDIIGEELKKDSTHYELIKMMIRINILEGDYHEAKFYVNKLLSRFPNDREGQKILSNLNKILKPNYSIDVSNIVKSNNKTAKRLNLNYNNKLSNTDTIYLRYIDTLSSDSTTSNVIRRYQGALTWTKQLPNFGTKLKFGSHYDEDSTIPFVINRDYVKFQLNKSWSENLYTYIETSDSVIPQDFLTVDLLKPIHKRSNKLFAKWAVLDHLSLSGATTEYRYSDDNRKDDYFLKATYTLLTKPIISVGYRYAFENSDGSSTIYNLPFRKETQTYFFNIKSKLTKALTVYFFYQPVIKNTKGKLNYERTDGYFIATKYNLLKDLSFSMRYYLFTFDFKDKRKEGFSVNLHYTF